MPSISKKVQINIYYDKLTCLPEKSKKTIIDFTYCLMNDLIEDIRWNKLYNRSDEIRTQIDKKLKDMAIRYNRGKGFTARLKN